MNFAKPFEWSSISSAVAILISLVAIVQAHNAMSFTQQVAYRTHKADQRGQFINDFVDAQGRYITILDRSYDRISYKFDRRTVILNLTDDELREIAQEVRGFGVEHGRLRTAMHSGLFLWCEPTADKVRSAYEPAFRISECFRWLEIQPKTISKDFYKRKRSELLEHCLSYEDDRNLLISAGNSLLNSLIDENEQTWSEEIEYDGK